MDSTSVNTAPALDNVAEGLGLVTFFADGACTAMIRSVSSEAWHRGSFVKGVGLNVETDEIALTLATGRFTILGKDRAKAFQAARICNARQAVEPRVEVLVAKVVTPKITIAEYISHFRDVHLRDRRIKGKPLSPMTMKHYKTHLATIEKRSGAYDLTQVTREDVTQFLDTFEAKTYRNLMRERLKDMFIHAVADGRRSDNPVEGTLRKDTVRLRRRMTIAEFEVIRSHAPEWFKLALDLALYTLLRREDIALLTTDDVHDNCLWITPGKNQGRVHISMNYIGTPLESVLTPFERVDRSSPVHLVRKPVGKKLRHVPPPVLSASFAALWAKHIGPRDDTSPTFHELRSLGGHLYEKKGLDPQHIYGHGDKKMTQHYLNGHAIDWASVSLNPKAPTAPPTLHLVA